VFDMFREWRVALKAWGEAPGSVSPISIYWK